MFVVVDGETLLWRFVTNWIIDSIGDTAGQWAKVLYPLYPFPLSGKREKGKEWLANVKKAEMTAVFARTYFLWLVIYSESDKLLLQQKVMS